MKTPLSSFIWLSLALFTLGLLVGCSQPQPDKPAAIKPKTKVLRLGHDMPTGTPLHRAALAFAEQVKDKSKGQISVEVFPNQVLGSDRQMIDMAQKGELDIILPPTAKLAHILPKMQIFDLPYLFPNAEAAYNAIDGQVGNTLLADFEDHGLLGVTIWESGFKQLTTAKPIERIEDFQSLKFRIMESPMLQDQFSAWGADAITIDFAKTYDVLRDKVADGQENPLGSIFNMKFHEVQQYIYLSNHGYLGQVFTLSKQSFETLSKPHQQIIINSALEITPRQREQAQDAQKKWMQALAREAIEIRPLSDEVSAFMRAKAKRVLEKYRLSFGTEVVEKILQLADEQKTFGDDQLVIALDADLQGNSSLSGLAIRRGIEMAIGEINAQGGILGKQLTLTARDNSMIPARGLDNLRKFSQIDNLVAVFTGISSPVVLAELAYIHQNRLLTLDPWAAATPIIDNAYEPNYVFRVSVRDEYAADFLLQNALEVSDKVGLLLVDNGWGRSNHKALVDSLGNRALKATTTQWFEWGTKDFSEALNNLYQAGSKVIIYVGNPVEARHMVNLMSKRDNPLTVISHWGITGGRFAVEARQALKKVDLRILQTFSFIDNEKPKVKAFVEQYKQHYSIEDSTQIVAPVGTAHAYDLTHLLVKAIERAGSADMSKIRDALETIEQHQGLVKYYNPPFTPEDHDALDRSDFILTRFQDHYLVPLGN